MIAHPDMLMPDNDLKGPQAQYPEDMYDQPRRLSQEEIVPYMSGRSFDGGPDWTSMRNGFG